MDRIMENSFLKDVQIRMNHLERQNLRLRNLVIILALLIVSACVMGQMNVQDTISAKELHIKDANGNTRISMGTHEGYPALILVPRQ